MKTVFSRDVITEDGQVIQSINIKKSVKNKDHFIQAYVNDLGALLKCSKGEIDYLIALMTLSFVAYDTNEIILNVGRRKTLSETANLKLATMYNIMNSLKKKNIIIENNAKVLYLNPKLFFYGSELEREKMLTLSIDYEICLEC